MKIKKERVDAMLVNQGHCQDQEQAKRLVMAGKVFMGTTVIQKPGDLIPSDTELWVKQKGRYVGRGGIKLEGALKEFSVEVDQKICLDIGASTGGFTDCLLQHGAKRIHAIDSGTNQLAWKIRSDQRVFSQERFNARHLKKSDLGELVDLIVIDVSFISLTCILPPAIEVLNEGGVIIMLIKPQFELLREEVDRGGVVKDIYLQEKALQKIREFVKSESRLKWVREMDSPIKGVEGNREFLALIKKL